MATLSGASWVSQFPSSSSVDDLKDPFRGEVKKFLAALAKAGAAVSISATYRPPERAYLMHYSFLIAKNQADPANVPAMAGVDIDWVHRNAAGQTDIVASRTGAAEMVTGYGIVYAPALTSRHTEGNAIDMTISWGGDLTIDQADGTATTIKSNPRTGDNANLQSVGAGYGVTKLVTDPPHWSSDGH